VTDRQLAFDWSDYFDKWRNERAAELQAEAAKWEDGRNYWRPDDVWQKTKHLDKAAYGAAMATLLRWQADRACMISTPATVSSYARKKSSWG
jgi:hypothetical protein